MFGEWVRVEAGVEEEVGCWGGRGAGIYWIN